jgi:5,10-methylenetetrahydromethanopterin reductase
MAPGRIAVAFGTGFTGRVAMGDRPLTWKYVADYVRAYRGLLFGETVDWQGARMRMLPGDIDHAVAQECPPILLGAMGPVGARYAEELGVNGIVVFGNPPETVRAHRWAAVLIGGTVVDVGEDHTGARVRDAAGPTWAINYHFPYALGGPDAIRDLPGGREFLTVVEEVDPHDRHLLVNEGHLMRMNRADVAAWEAGGHVLLDELHIVATADEIARTAEEFAGLGVTELIYQPAGSDIASELERFRDAMQ